MSDGRMCHECRKYACECEHDVVAEARAEFIRDVLRACRKSGVTLDMDYDRMESCGIDLPCFVSTDLTEEGFGFRVDVGDLENAIRRSR